MALFLTIFSAASIVVGPITPVQPALPIAPALPIQPVTIREPQRGVDADIYAVAARCLAEATFAVYECACSVRNRMRSGATLAQVLSAYFAPDREPSERDLAEVRRAFSGDAMNNLYYMLGTGDTWLPHDRDPVLTIIEGPLAVRFYAK